jgi:hypothetical protein
MTDASCLPLLAQQLLVLRRIKKAKVPSSPAGSKSLKAPLIRSAGCRPQFAARCLGSLPRRCGLSYISPPSPSRPPWLGVAQTEAGTVVCFAGLFSDPIIAAI